MSVLKDRLALVEGITLVKGAHDSLEQGACVMELASYVAGEAWSDRPSCVSPVLGAFLRRRNDDLDDEGRQKLKPFLPRVIGTAGDGQDEARGWLAADWLVRVHTPAWLELAGVTEAAGALRSLPELCDRDVLNVARPKIDAARKGAAAAWAAAWAVARDAAAGDAAGDAAAGDAAGDAAAGDAAWDAAALDAAWAAALDAAWAAALDAAWVAAWAAARDVLEPTKVELQASALELLERMIDPAGAAS